MSEFVHLKLTKPILDHLCCNRLCCNHEHLGLVTHKQNQRRKTIKQTSIGKKGASK